MVMSVLSTDNYLLFSGGNDVSDQYDTRYHPENYIYDLETNTFTDIDVPDMVYGRAGHGLVEVYKKNKFKWYCMNET